MNTTLTHCESCDTTYRATAQGTTEYLHPRTHEWTLASDQSYAQYFADVESVDGETQTWCYGCMVEYTTTDALGVHHEVEL